MILAITVALFLSQVERVHGPVSHAGLTLEAPLTEGAVVTISERAGVPVTTDCPEAAFTEAQANTYLSVFREVLARPHKPCRPKHKPPKKSRYRPHED